jgi:Bacterial Ig-like domain (group 3)
MRSANKTARSSTLKSLLLLIVAAIGVLACVLPAGPSAAAERTTSGTVGWTKARSLPLPYKGPDEGGNAAAISCSGPGDCVVAGNYTANSSGLSVPFLAEEKKGTWGGVEKVPGLAALDGGLTASLATVSCGSPGNCAAGGSFNRTEGETAFLVTEINGAWQHAILVPGLATTNQADSLGSFISSVACPAKGDCTAVGSGDPTDDGSAPFAVSETGGHWSAATLLPGGGGQASCGAPGDCTAASYGSIATESNGHWGAAQKAPALLPNVQALACAGASYCIIGGEEEAANPEAFSSATYAVETKGTFGAAKALPGEETALGDDVTGMDLDDLACASAGNCTTAGRYFVYNGITPSKIEIFVARETRGTWHQPTALPGLVELDKSQADPLALSCSTLGNCALTGTYALDSADDADTQFVALEISGTWSKAEPVPGLAALGGVSDQTSFGQTQDSQLSCAPQGYCAAVGTYSNVYGDFPFVTSTMKLPTTTTSVALSQPRARYGDEQAVRVKVTVRSASGTPAGTVTVTAGSGAVCVVALKAGAGACALPKTRFAAGTVKLSARYAGSAAFAPSGSALATITVLKANTKTGLALSAAKISYGHESSEKLTVKVAPRYAGVPAGRVAVKVGSATLCVITLKSGAGSCSLAAKRLKPGTYQLVASYAGNADYTGSASSKLTLTVLG